MSDMDAMRGRAQRLTGMNLERMRGISSRLNTETLDAGVMIAIGVITTDPKIQVRVGGLNRAKVESYAEAIKAGAKFPPVELFREGDTLWLSDGYHRLAAHRLAGMKEIAAVVRPGTRQDAFDNAESANLLHGLELTMDDKKNIYFRRLARNYWESADMSFRQVAKEFGVSHSTVRRWLHEYESGEVTKEAPESGVSFATPAEAQAKAEKASARKKPGRKPTQKRAPTQLQLKQRALKNLRAAADAFDLLDMAQQARWTREFADEMAAEWGL